MNRVVYINTAFGEVPIGRATNVALAGISVSAGAASLQRWPTIAAVVAAGTTAACPTVDLSSLWREIDDLERSPVGDHALSKLVESLKSVVEAADPRSRVHPDPLADYFDDRARAAIKRTPKTGKYEVGWIENFLRELYDGPDKAAVKLPAMLGGIKRFRCEMVHGNPFQVHPDWSFFARTEIGDILVVSDRVDQHDALLERRALVLQMKANRDASIPVGESTMKERMLYSLWPDFRWNENIARCLDAKGTPSGIGREPRTPTDSWQGGAALDMHLRVTPDAWQIAPFSVATKDCNEAPSVHWIYDWDGSTRPLGTLGACISSRIHHRSGPSLQSPSSADRDWSRIVQDILDAFECDDLKTGVARGRNRNGFLLLHVESEHPNDFWPLSQ